MKLFKGTKIHIGSHICKLSKTQKATEILFVILTHVVKLK